MMGWWDRSRLDGSKFDTSRSENAMGSIRPCTAPVVPPLLTDPALVRIGSLGHDPGATAASTARDLAIHQAPRPVRAEEFVVEDAASVVPKDLATEPVFYP